MNRIFLMTMVLPAVLLASAASAMIDGVPGPDFVLTAKSGTVSTPEGNAIHFWGYANGAGPVQYPGPTMLVTAGETVTVTLNNELPVPVSIVFPGQVNVQPTGVTPPHHPGSLTLEAEPGGTVQYVFRPLHPGTYLYHSGTRPDLQIEMGLVGALIVYPASGGMHMKDGMMMGGLAYDHPDTAYDVEYLFLLTEMDPEIHYLVEAGRLDEVDTRNSVPMYYFINGRCAPDTMGPAPASWLPTQPYNSMPMMHAGERLLMRVANAGKLIHPFHFHGNNATTVARQGRLLSSMSGGNPDLSVSHFTIQSVPGDTEDAIFTWTGAKLGWDIYGHEHDIDNPPTGNFPAEEDVDHNGNGELDTVPLEPGEYEPDHGKPLPVFLPENGDLTFGAMWSGSPFLGAMGSLPPGEGGMNPSGGLVFMWHSHTEKELLNGDIFPGGMMTMLIVDAPGVPHEMR